MAANIKTNYMHRIGPVVISTGIGDTMYGAYAVKPNGSLKRLKQIEQDPHWTVVSFRLDTCKSKTIWKNNQ